MAYVKTIWKDSPDNTTPLNSANLNKIENGIATLDTEKTTALLATNLVTNGDFSNGTTGWVGTGSTISALSNIMSCIGNGASASVRAEQTTVDILSVNNKYYFRARMRLTNSLASSIFIILLGTTVVGSVPTISLSSPTVDTWYTLSDVLTNTTGTGNLKLRLQHSYVDAATANGKVMEVQYVSAINLTQIFGAGNEPTKEQMDWLLAQRFTNSWFDGTKELATIKEIMKIAQVQSPYITPTLLNSRTGTLKYLLTNDGFVNLKGTASGGTLNTDIIVLPIGYRPNETLTFPISANNAFGVVTISNTGLVRQTVGALTNVSLSGITFEAEL